MRRTLFALSVLLLVPVGSHAASFSAARSVLLANPAPGNSYAAGATVVVTAPVAGDLSAIGGSLITAASVAGDALLLGGSVSSRGPVAGDLRAAGGSVSVEGPVAGDLVAFGLGVNGAGRVLGSAFIVAANITMERGAEGPVTIYGNNVSLHGDFGGDVRIIAWGRVALSASTTIDGTLSYEAPVEAIIPDSAVIKGGVHYTNASYLPDAGTSRILSLISIGFFLLVRILGALILAGLFAGLFPRFSAMIVERAESGHPRSLLLTTLLGFAVFAATPVLFLLLALTFVGLGLALLFLIAYALLVLLSLVYAGILLGSLFARRFMRRDSIRWHDGVLGMLALSAIALVPYIGPLVLSFLMFFSAGALLLAFFHFAFPRDTSTPESV